MLVRITSDESVSIDLEKDEIHLLLTVLLNAKFPDEPRAELFCNKKVNFLIKGLLDCGKRVGLESGWFSNGDTFKIEEGMVKNQAFSFIEQVIDDFDSEVKEELLAEAFFPYVR